MEGQNPFGRLPRSGALAPRGSSGANADSHVDGQPDPTGPGTVPVWANGSFVPAMLFLVVAYMVWRIAVR